MDVASNAKASRSRIFEDHVSQMWQQLQAKEGLSFHRAMRKTVILLAMFQLFPVSGIFSRIPDHLRIKRLSPLYFINTFFLALASVDLILVLRLAVFIGFGIKSTTAFTFSIVTLCAGFVLRELAEKWPSLMQFWKQHEVVFLKYPYREPRYSLDFLLTTVSAFMMFLVLIDHALSLAKSTSENTENMRICNLTESVNFLHHMYHRERPQIFNLVPFHIWMIPFLEFTRLMLSICWTFIDVVIINISIGLTVRFQQLRERIIDNCYTSLEDVWADIRHHYGQLTDLVAKVDESISTLILLSCANNMYFICYFVFQSFTYVPDATSVALFWFELLLAIFKTTAVLYSASTVNETATSLANSIRQVPSNCWNIETERLVEQVECQSVALTGKNLFRLTRSLMLAFAGTIVTLEIVLIDHRDKYEGAKVYKCDVSF